MPCIIYFDILIICTFVLISNKSKSLLCRPLFCYGSVPKNWHDVKGYITRPFLFTIPWVSFFHRFVQCFGVSLFALSLLLYFDFVYDVSSDLHFKHDYTFNDVFYIFFFLTKVLLTANPIYYFIYSMHCFDNP